MKWSEIERIAKKNGFKFKKHLGSHDLWVKEGTSKRFLMERHKSQEVKRGLLNDLKKIIEF